MAAPLFFGMVVMVALTMVCSIGTAVATLSSFVFGDSLVDAGNNNYLPLSIATAKTLPNGIDFPYMDARNPTGRFTNGLTIPDLIAQKLGSNFFALPFLAPTTAGAVILNGVNYASGGGGILNDTGRIFIQRLSLDVQLSNFERGTVPQLNALLGKENVASFLSKSIFSVAVGSNDLLDNFISPFPLTPDKFQAWEFFRHKLLDRLQIQLTRLYNLGARKIVVVNMPKIGCTPYLRSIHVLNNGTCASIANLLAQSYNVPLKQMLQQLNAQLAGATFLCADAYGATDLITSNYLDYGFVNADKACCGLGGSERGFIPCRSFTALCTERFQYFFWDPYHPTQAAYEIIAQEFFEGSEYISPMNIKQLAAL